ncbi:hypothetical protein SAMN05444172_2560 [Burkholderia sp. GAS332]|nr:hypothetical protein SAMN05444172_2560 [Burkholderia sp. GAS332]
MTPSVPSFINAMSLNSVALWNDFLRYFQTELYATPKGHLRWAWASAFNRTKFYQNCLLPKVAQRMGLVARYEMFRVDSSFCVPPGNSIRVPIVQVESENNAHSALHEVAKLCALVGPLKVLIVCQQWSSLGRWQGGGSETMLLPKWRTLVKEHEPYYPNNGSIGLIVGEFSDADEHLRFYSTLLNGEADCGPPFFETPLVGAPFIAPNCPDRREEAKRQLLAERAMAKSPAPGTDAGSDSPSQDL